MEPVDADNEDRARAQAAAILSTHASGIAAHVLLDDALIATIRRPGQEAV